MSEEKKLNLDWRKMVEKADERGGRTNTADTLLLQETIEQVVKLRERVAFLEGYLDRKFGAMALRPVEWTTLWFPDQANSIVEHLKKTYSPTKQDLAEWLTNPEMLDKKLDGSHGAALLGSAGPQRFVLLAMLSSMGEEMLESGK